MQIICYNQKTCFFDVLPKQADEGSPVVTELVNRYSQFFSESDFEYYALGAWTVRLFTGDPAEIMYAFTGVFLTELFESFEDLDEDLTGETLKTDESYAILVCSHDEATIFGKDPIVDLSMFLIETDYADREMGAIYI